MYTLLKILDNLPLVRAHPHHTKKLPKPKLEITSRVPEYIQYRDVTTFSFCSILKVKICFIRTNSEILAIHHNLLIDNITIYYLLMLLKQTIIEN